MRRETLSERAQRLGWERELRGARDVEATPGLPSRPPTRLVQEYEGQPRFEFEFLDPEPEADHG